MNETYLTAVIPVSVSALSNVKHSQMKSILDGTQQVFL